jgi:hypothetical protein
LDKSENDIKTLLKLFIPLKDVVVGTEVVGMKAGEAIFSDVKIGTVYKVVDIHYSAGFITVKELNQGKERILPAELFNVSVPNSVFQKAYLRK